MCPASALVATVRLDSLALDVSLGLTGAAAPMFLVDMAPPVVSWSTCLNVSVPQAGRAPSVTL